MVFLCKCHQVLAHGGKKIGARKHCRPCSRYYVMTFPLVWKDVSRTNLAKHDNKQQMCKTFLIKCCGLYYCYWGLVSPFHMSTNKPGLLQRVFFKSASHIKAHLKYMQTLVLFRQWWDLHPYTNLRFMTSVKWEFKIWIRKLYLVIPCTRYNNKISQKRCKFLLSSVLPKLHFSGCWYKNKYRFLKM